MHHSCLQMKPALVNVVAGVVVAGVGEIAFHQMSLETHEMAAVVVEAEERRRRGTKSIASNPVLIEHLG